MIDPAAFAGIDHGASVLTLDGETMGTTWRVLAVARDADSAALNTVIHMTLARIVAEMSHWEPESLLSRFNDLAAGDTLPLPPDFARVMEVALAVAAASDGAFDPAIGALVDLWGFGPPGPMPPPTREAIEAARRVSGWRRLEWDPAAKVLLQPGGCRLDLSGIAKGHAVDAVAHALGDMGVKHALVEVGGELVGRGVRPDGEPWWVDLEDPPGIALPKLRVALHGLAVATSGNYRRGDHTVDPRTGMPVARTTVSVSVIADDAVHADAWATALTVLDKDAPACAERHGIAVRLIERIDGVTHEWLSPALIAMLN